MCLSCSQSSSSYGRYQHIVHCFTKCDLRATQMNVKCSLIWEPMLYPFQMGPNATESTKNICCAKREGTVDHSTVSRWFKKFHSGCKKLNYQAKSDRPKIMPQAIDTNLVSFILRVLGSLASHNQNCGSSPSQTLQKHPKLLNCALCYQNIAKLFSHLDIWNLISHTYLIIPFVWYSNP